MLGGGLHSWLFRKRAPLPLAIKYRLAIEIAGGLSHLHSVNMMHRDLKPENIFVDEDCRHAKLGDLGIAFKHMSYCIVIILLGMAVVTTRTVKTVTGTYLYMVRSVTQSARALTPSSKAPEVLRGDSYGTPADVYSFAMVATEIFTSERCFPVGWNTYQRMHIEVGSGNARPQLTATVPALVGALLEQAWRKNPVDRPTMIMLTAELRKLAAQANTA